MIITISPSWEEYEEHLYYTYADYQGSLIALTDENGTVVERYAYDPWGARRNPDNWTLPPSPQGEGTGVRCINRGYTGHEHLDAFGIINMNGRVYDPLTATFFSPDPVLQAPGNWVNYNRYGYCMGNPFAYTDPSGYSWVSNAGSWLNHNWKPIVAGVVGIGVGIGVGLLTGGAGLAVAIQIGVLAGTAGGTTSAVLGTALNGGSFGDCFMAGTKGGIFGGITGGVGGGLSMIGGAGMSFAENLLLGTGEGAITGGLGAALSGDDIGEGILMGAIGGAVLTTIFSENMNNAFKGKGFYTNENVFNHMISDGISKADILKYFKINGKYNPTDVTPSYIDGNKNNYLGYTNAKGEINFGDAAFNSYTNLIKTYTKELYHQAKVLNKIPFETQNIPEVKDSKFFPEERLGFIHQYENQGLYPKANTDIIKGKIAYYQLQSYNLMPNQHYKFNWYDFIYKIPRRW